MEVVIANIGRVVRRRENNKDYLVAPITGITPGVLPGNRGNVYYSPQQTGHEPEKWNKIPIIVNHPKDEKGEYIAFPTPEMLEKFGLGELRDSRFDGKLRFTGWFEEDRVKTIVPLIHQKLLRGEQIEVSTGLVAEAFTLANVCEDHLKRPYLIEARNIKPGHLAVLTDGPGACSIAHGCGVFANQVSHREIRNELETQLQQRFEPKRKMGGDGIYQEINYEDHIWVEEIYDKYVIFRQGEQRWKLGYTTDLRTNKIELSNDNPQEVTKVITYKTVNSDEKKSLANATGLPEVGDIWILDDKNTTGTWNGSSWDVISETQTKVLNGKFVDGKWVADDYKVTTTFSIDSNILPPGKNSEGGSPNKETPMALTAEQKAQIITNLSSNCKCHASMPWKSLTQEQMNALSDDTLTAYDTTQKALVNAQPTPTPAPTPAPVVPTPAPQVVTPPVAPVVVNRLTPDEEEDLAFARAERMRRKTELVDRLTNQITDPAQKQSAVAIYNAMKPGDLALLAGTIPAPQVDPMTQYNQWMMSPGAAVVNSVPTTVEPLAQPDYSSCYKQN